MGQSPTRRMRKPAVAGTFYPADAHQLATMVDRYLREAVLATTTTEETGATDATVTGVAGHAPKAIIAPHAGYVYSGSIAARAHVCWQNERDVIRRIVLLGPAHRVAVRAMALSSADVWMSPLGTVPIDTDLSDRALSCDGVVIDDRAHAPEHSLEVHIPFLQRVLEPAFTLLPIVVGHATADQIADVLDAVWGDDQTRIVVSTDLSHYLPYAEAKEIDRHTAATIVARSAHLDPQQACGAHPVLGMLESARRHRLQVSLLDLRNSGDTAGPRDRVVGYGAFSVG